MRNLFQYLAPYLMLSALAVGIVWQRNCGPKTRIYVDSNAVYQVLCHDI